MFGEEFGDCWHEIPGVSGLELSGDLRFRGPSRLKVVKQLRNHQEVNCLRKSIIRYES